MQNTFHKTQIVVKQGLFRSALGKQFAVKGRKKEKVGERERSRAGEIKRNKEKDKREKYKQKNKCMQMIYQNRKFTDETLT